jgi:hypothetical protein
MVDQQLHYLWGRSLACYLEWCTFGTMTMVDIGLFLVKDFLNGLQIA